MKKINNISAPLTITTRRPTVTSEFSIKVAGGGSLTQAEDTTYSPSLYEPDRSIFPLILEPAFSAIDDSTKESLSTNAVYKWYVNEVVETWDSSKEEGLVPETLISGNYYLEKDAESGIPTGRLVITKNVDYLTTVTIFCIVNYTDSIHSAIYKEEQHILLTTENKPEDFYDVNMLTPSPIIYNPFGDFTEEETDSTISIKADVTKGKEHLDEEQLAGIKFFWYFDDIPVEESGSSAYVSGQGTDTLVIDADYADMLTIKVMIANNPSASEPNVHALDEKVLKWEYPQITVEPYSLSGSAVKNSEGEKVFMPFVKVNGHDLAEAKWKKYMRLQWVSKDTATGVETERGWGEVAIINNSELYSKDTAININAFLLGPLEKVTMNEEEITQDGEQIWCRN